MKIPVMPCFSMEFMTGEQIHVFGWFLTTTYTMLAKPPFKHNFVPVLRTQAAITGIRTEFLYNGGEWRCLGKWDEEQIEELDFYGE